MGLGAGLAVGGIGMLLGNRENRRATNAAVRAAQFQPFSVNGPAGSVQVGNDGQIQLTADPREQAFSDSLRTGGMSQMQLGLGQLNNLRAPGMVSAPGVGRRIGVRSFTNDLRRLSNHSALDPSQMNQAVRQGNILATRGMEHANQMGGLGSRFLDQAGSTDINQLAAQRMQQLNSLATPFEDREASALADRLFMSGQAGTTGGSRQFGDLAQALERAQTERALAAAQFGADEQNRLVGLGSGLIGQGQQIGSMGLQTASGLIGARADLIGQRFQQLLGTSQDHQARQGLLMNQENNLFGQRLARQGFIADQRQSQFTNRLGLAQTRMQAGVGQLGLAQEFNPFANLMQQGGLSATMSGAASGAGAEAASHIARGGRSRGDMISSMFGGMMNPIINAGS